MKQEIYLWKLLFMKLTRVISKTVQKILMRIKFEGLAKIHQFNSLPIFIIIFRYIHAYIHAYMHTYIHAYIHTYIYIHTYRHTHTQRHTQTHTYIYIYYIICNILLPQSNKGTIDTETQWSKTSPAIQTSSAIFLPFLRLRLENNMR